ncbi:hypothetical protein [Nocardioides yefusunii]|uniref:Carboxypeptidase regulatory-like domain-containing protein n=1 Tax=Nocardioides yefusunii TaxID=2500546 RepID=A0ABW1QVK5_9ACTN|nr:hypothetical protein [Nocardioides yefusunii]
MVVLVASALAWTPLLWNPPAWSSLATPSASATHATSAAPARTPVVARVVADVRGGQAGALSTTVAKVDLQVRTRAGRWKRATGWSHRTTGRRFREVDLRGVRPGVYRVVVTHPHYLVATTAPFRVRGSAPVKLAPIRLDRGARVTGTYVADGGWSMEHPPTARAYLRTRTSSGKWTWKLVREARTVALEDDVTDAFDLRGLPAGTYAVCIHVRTTGCLGGSSPRTAQQVKVAARSTVADLVIRRTTL